MRLLVTRPAEDVGPLIEALTALGHEAVAAPLLTIRFLAETALPQEELQAIMVTSANGARALAAREDRAALAALPVLAVGPASATAMREAGFQDVESAEGDVEALARRAAARLDPSQGALLHIAGTVSAGDLKGALEAEGFRVRRAVLYEAVAAERLPSAARRELAGGTLDGVLLYSARTARSFADLVAAEELTGKLADVAAYCLSANVARVAETLPFRAIHVAAAPRQDAMLHLLSG